jgi:hypothetical protein
MEGNFPVALNLAALAIGRRSTRVVMGKIPACATLATRGFIGRAQRSPSIRTGSQMNKARQFFIPRDMVEKVLSRILKW